jgi:hypothetical protein
MTSPSTDHDEDDLASIFKRLEQLDGIDESKLSSTALKPLNSSVTASTSKSNNIILYSIGGVFGLNILFLPFFLGTLRKNAVPFITTTNERSKAIFSSLRKAYHETEPIFGKIQTKPSFPTSRSPTTMNFTPPLPPHRPQRPPQFIDLGSGDGRLVFAAAKLPKSEYPEFQFERSVGVEINLSLIAYSWARTFLDRSLPKECRILFMKRDLWKLDLEPYSTVMVFGDLRLMVRRHRPLSRFSDSNLVLTILPSLHYSPSFAINFKRSCVTDLLLLATFSQYLDGLQ